MFATVYRLRPRDGQKEALLAHIQKWSQERLPKVEGYVGGYMLWSATRSNEIAGIAVFDSQSNFHKNANDPEQDQWYQQLRSLLESDPEWNDGEIIAVDERPVG